jgi:glycerol-3-phosphate acyltransferase PlsY
MQSEVMIYLLVIVAAYLVGSVPFGFILTRFAGKGDIRTIGSGNIGATNVLRTGSKPLAVLTLLLDAGKGALITLIVANHGDSFATALAGFAVVVGHCFPVWLRFHGGKGVATSLAVFAAFDWRIGLVFCGVWLATAAVSKYSSLAALVATLGCVIAAFWLVAPLPIAAAIGLMTGVTWMRHHQNIGRLLTNSEPKIGAK